MKVSSAAPPSAGRSWGSTTRQSVRQRPAPRLAAASSSDASSDWQRRRGRRDRSRRTSSRRAPAGSPPRPASRQGGSVRPSSRCTEQRDEAGLAVEEQEREHARPAAAAPPAAPPARPAASARELVAREQERQRDPDQRPPAPRWRARSTGCPTAPATRWAARGTRRTYPRVQPAGLAHALEQHQHQRIGHQPDAGPRAAAPREQARARGPGHRAVGGKEVDARRRPAGSGMSPTRAPAGTACGGADHLEHRAAIGARP